MVQQTVVQVQFSFNSHTFGNFSTVYILVLTYVMKQETYEPHGSPQKKIYLINIFYQCYDFERRKKLYVSFLRINGSLLIENTLVSSSKDALCHA